MGDVPAILEAGTSQAGAAATITLDAAASATNTIYAGNWIMITGGTGIGQTRLISAYVGATKVATITPVWTTNPDATSVYQVVPSARVDVSKVAGTLQTANDNGADINAILTDTAEIGAAGAGLTAVPWNAAWDAEVQSEVADALVAVQLDHLLGVDTTVAADGDLTTYCVDGSVMSHLLSTGADTSTYKASTDAQESLLTVPFVDIGAGAPSATASWFTGLNYLYMAWRNKTVTNGTNSEIEFYNDANTKIAESDISDDGTDFTRGEIGAVD
jgi:hypothetical protein